jgi:hypothetical protein
LNFENRDAKMFCSTRSSFWRLVFMSTVPAAALISSGGSPLSNITELRCPLRYVRRFDRGRATVLFLAEPPSDLHSFFGRSTTQRPRRSANPDIEVGCIHKDRFWLILLNGWNATLRHRRQPTPLSEPTLAIADADIGTGAGHGRRRCQCRDRR